MLSRLLDLMLELFADQLYFHRETLLASNDRHDSCPSDRKFCPLSSVVCSRLLSLAAGPVKMSKLEFVIVLLKGLQELNII